MLNEYIVVYVSVFRHNPNKMHARRTMSGKRSSLTMALHDPESTGALLPINLQKETKETPEARKKRTSHRIEVSMGDSFSPLNDDSRLGKRNDYVRYFGDQKKYVFMRQFLWAVHALMGENKDEFKKEFDRLRAEELTPHDKVYAEFIKGWFGDGEKIPRQIIDDAYDMVKYRPLTGVKYVARVGWIMCTLGGIVPRAWDTITSSSFVMAGSLVTSYLIQSQTEVTNLVNGSETWVEVDKFLYNMLQMGAIVMLGLGVFMAINYVSYIWKSHGRIIREARFATIMQRRLYNNPTTSDLTLDYNTDCDPDVADAYFTLRQEACTRGGGGINAFGRLRELFGLYVDDRLLKGILCAELGLPLKVDGIL